MKVALLTFHQADNFGAVWQTYGLSKTLCQLGHDPFLIDYHPDKLLRSYRVPTGRFVVTPRMIGFLKKKLEFNRFRRILLPATTRLFKSYDDLRKNPPVADAYITGSDQVWNPDLMGGRYDPAFFLQFVKSGRRISYAASFGETRQLIPTDELREYLSHLDAISVREEQAARILKAAYDIEIAAVCDPVFLLQDYTNYLTMPCWNREFVFTYNLFNLRDTDELSLELGKALNCEVRRVNDDWKLWNYSSKAEFGISPIRWLNLIQSAKLIFTDSFHATAFSILLRKPFLSVLSNSQTTKANRIVSLLEQLQLQEKIVSKDDTIDDVLERYNQPIDWETVHRKIADARQDALNYLSVALAG